MATTDPQVLASRLRYLSRVRPIDYRQSPLDGQIAEDAADALDRLSAEVERLRAEQ